jgi:hypothetical protein
VPSCSVNTEKSNKLISFQALKDRDPEINRFFNASDNSLKSMNSPNFNQNTLNLLSNIPKTDKNPVKSAQEILQKHNNFPSRYIKKLKKIIESKKFSKNNFSLNHNNIIKTPQMPFPALILNTSDKKQTCETTRETVQTVQTEYYQINEEQPEIKPINKRIPSTSRRKTSRFHFRTGSLHKNTMSRNSDMLNNLSFKHRGNNPKHNPKPSFNFCKIMNKNLKINKKRKNYLFNIKDSKPLYTPKRKTLTNKAWALTHQASTP